MWFLEWEENSEDHKKKQKKWLVLAIVCWAAALVVLFVTEKILYGEILKTNASGFLGATVGTAIIFFLQSYIISLPYIVYTQNKKPVNA